MDSSNEDAAWVKVMEVASLCCLPSGLKAAVDLNVLEILAKHAGEAGGFLSASQIVSHFHARLASTTSLEQAAASLDRVLRVLASHDFLSSSLLTTPQGVSTRTYALNSLSQLLLQNEETQSSLAPYLLLLVNPLFLDPFLHIQEGILEGAPPFDKAHGLPFWPYLKKSSTLNALFNKSMGNISEPLMRNLLERYRGFEDITSLIDVGGGNGSCIQMIVSKHPHIKGINFDQVHVIANAPQYPGITHVGGDMFVKIPQANAIFMKWILHNWSDAQCFEVLKNCYQALPEQGKVIVVDIIVTDQVEYELDSRSKYHMDFLMLTLFQHAKERTHKELDTICKACGFSRSEVVCSVNGNNVVEIFKEPLRTSSKAA